MKRRINRNTYMLAFYLLMLLTLGCSNKDVPFVLPDSPKPPKPEETAATPQEVESPQPRDAPVEPRFHIIWDDDGSSDGMIALMYFLRHPEVKVEAMTISNGEAYPHQFAGLLERMLVKLNRTDILIGAGSETPLIGDRTFSENTRLATREFWGIELPKVPIQQNPLDAATLIVEVVRASPEPITFFMSGPHTNLAQALRLDPSIKDNIASIEIMGGALYVPGNVANGSEDMSAEWNIFIDPLAAQEVFSSGIPIVLTPLDATKKIVWDRLDAGAWLNAGTPESMMASELLSWMLNNWSDLGIYVWDLDTAVNFTRPDLCESEDLYVEVFAKEGSDEGRTVLVDGKDPNVTACLRPDSESIRKHVKEIFRNN